MSERAIKAVWTGLDTETISGIRACPIEFKKGEWHIMPTLVGIRVKCFDKVFPLAMINEDGQNDDLSPQDQRSASMWL